MKRLSYLLVLSTVLLTGCATIMGHPTQMVPISSTPSGAKVTITDETGAMIYTGVTPASVTLKKSDGSYWGKKSYKVIISKPGYQKVVIPITAHANGWYIGGNFVFGGLIGWFIIDPLNGDMYTLSPQKVAGTLGQKQARNTSGTNGRISIVLLQDVPTSLRSQMKRIN
ncbi:MAG: hypothetical protein ACK2T0_04990 [Anaerolineales bacterium]|jgi:hypothetical protein